MGVGPSTTVEMEAENIVDEKKGEKDPATRREEPANKGGGDNNEGKSDQMSDVIDIDIDRNGDSGPPVE